MCRFGEGGDFGGGVAGAEFGYLGDGDHAGLGVVVAAHGVESCGDVLRADLPSGVGAVMSFAPSSRSAAPVSWVAMWAGSAQMMAS